MPGAPQLIFRDLLGWSPPWAGWMVETWGRLAAAALVAAATALPWMVLTQQAISLLYQYWLHTESIRTLGPLELIFNTPSHHRVHHGKNVAYLDKNHGGILIVWDRLFGTFTPEDERVVYGLTKDLDTFHPLRIDFHELATIAHNVARAPTLRAKLGYVLAPPGWSHDGSSQTAGQLQRR